MQGIPINAVLGPACVLIGIFVALWVKDKAREVAKQEFAEGIKFALSEFKGELIVTLDETYSRSAEIKLMLESRDDRLDVMDERIACIEGDIKQLEDKMNRCKNFVIDHTK